MRINTLFSRTRRKSKGTPDSISNELLVRSGYIRQLASGIYTYLPLAVRVIRKIEGIVRDEMEAIGGQEIIMPVVSPADIWKESGRWYQIDAEMGRFNDRSGRDMVLAMTHEEVISDLARNEIHSYRQLPCTLYHIQTKWRDDPRPRAGLIRVREFTMKDSYSLDLDATGMQRQYEAHYGAYFNIFDRCGLPVRAVSSDLGMMGGAQAHEYMYKSDSGEDTIIHCATCGYASNRQIATSRKDSISDPNEPPLPIEKVHTPNASTIDSLSACLKLPKQRLAKAVFIMAAAQPPVEGERFILAVIRGDLEVNETKLINAIGAKSLRPALDEEIRMHGIEPGFGSPVGAKDATVVIDDTIRAGANFVAGANEPDYHLLNVNESRDFNPDIVADIAYAEAGMPCPECSGQLSSYRGIEVGNIFKLGARYSASMNCTYLDNRGEQQPIFMGSYGIGIGRLMACIVEEYHDQYGIIWPPAVAPFEIHLIDLCSEPERGKALYNLLTASGVDVMFDDRTERAGVKFNDADLMGAPIRLTLGDRSLESDSIEIKLRWERDSKMLSLDSMPEAIKSIIEELPRNFAAARHV